MPRRHQECKDKVNFADCTVVQLKAELRQRGLQLGGRKAELLARLLEHERRNRRRNGRGREEKKQRERKEPQAQPQRRKRRRPQKPRMCFDVIMQGDENIKKYIREDRKNIVFIIGENAHCFNYDHFERLIKLDIFECKQGRGDININPHESKRLYKVSIGGAPYFFKPTQINKVMDSILYPRGRSRVFSVITRNNLKRVGTKTRMIAYRNNDYLEITYVRENTLPEINQYQEGFAYGNYGRIPLYSHHVENIIKQVGGSALHRCNNRHDPRAVAADTVRISYLRPLRSFAV